MRDEIQLQLIYTFETTESIHFYSLRCRIFDEKRKTVHGYHKKKMYT